MRTRWRAVALFLVAAVLIVVWSVYVFLWYVANAQSSGLVPPALGSWTMANLVTFILHAIFWEIVLIGIPTAIIAMLAWRLWWNRLPIQERTMYEMTPRRRTAGSGGFSFLVFIAFCIKVYLDGKWHVPISSFTLDYVVSSMVSILLWSLAIVGVPAAIGLTWWLNHEMKKP